jgi:type I restriction enzyme S subunit
MKALPTGWEYVGLLDIADSLDSRRVPVNRKERDQRLGGVPYYGATGQVGWIDRPLFDEELCLLGEDGAPFLDRSKSKAYLIDGPSWVNNHAHVLRALSGITSNRFLKYALDQVDYTPFVNGTTRLKLTKGAMGRIGIPLPPLAEQQRIVAAIEEQFSRLDAAESSLKHGRQQLALLRAAVFVEAFDGDWPLSPLSEINDPDRPICYGILMPKEHRDDGVLYVKVKDYPKGKVLLDQLNRTASEIAAKYRRSSLRPRDILLSIRGTYGRVAVAPPELDGANITQDTARVAPQPHVGVDYLAAYLRSAQAQRYFRQVARGVAVKGVNIGDLRTMPVLVPPVAAQAKIVEELERRLSIIDAMEGEIDHALRAGISLRRSILKCAFMGKLAPQDPTDEPATVLLERIAGQRAALSNPSRRRRNVPA